MFCKRLKAFDVLIDVVVIDQILGHDDVEHGVEQRHVRARCELDHMIGVAAQGLTAWVHDDQLRAVALGALDEGRGHRVVLRWACADNDDDVGFFGVGERCGHSARSDSFHQGSDA